MDKSRLSKGIVLITTLLIIGFLLMFAAGIIFTTQRQATMTNQFYHRETAIFASQTGINYALMRLNADPYWMGCQRSSSGLTGSDYSFTMASGQKIDIREHQVSGNMGAVEGRIDGGNSGYFEIYFVKPEDAKSKLTFFGTSSGLLPLPAKIPLSSNRNNQLTAPTTNPGEDPSTWTKYSDDSYYKPVPENSILLVCRGTMGNEHKTLELCVRMGPGEDYNSVVIGRGDISINLNPAGKLLLDTVVSDKPPIIRTKGSINISNGLTAASDYLVVNGSGGGRASGSVGFTPAPSNFANTFQGGVAIQENMFPPLQISKVAPDTASYSKLNTGYYKIEEVNNVPKITYYAVNKADDITGSTELKPITDGSDTLTMLLNNGTMIWNSKENSLELNKSVNVASTQSLSNLTIVGSNNEPLDLNLKSVIDPKKGSINNVYLVNNNDNGNINVAGSIKGIGTIVLKGNLDMQGESQLSAVEDSGISIYAQGDININAIPVTPRAIKGIEKLSDDDRHRLNDAIGMICDWTSNMQSASIAAHMPKQDKYALAKSNCQFRYGVDDDTWNLFKQVGLVTVGDLGCYKNVEYLYITEADVNKAIAADLKYTSNATKMNKMGKKVDPKDCKFTGLIFTCKNFNVNIPNNDFALTGGLVAYGGDPASGAASAGAGFININANSAEFNYDTKYLSMLQGLSSSKIETLYWGSY
ncbi:MAG: hypothetical protein LWY06_11380 [Firmicutes bacterium]|nr:hypothetical protein [Bacillota bacterium]